VGPAAVVEGMRYFERRYGCHLPGVFISAAVFGANLFGDALRDVWTPNWRSLGLFEKYQAASFEH